MASGKEIAGGIVGLVILASLVQPDEYAPPPPPRCNVPQADGTTIPVEVTTIPCDQMVQRALTELESAQALRSKLPEVVTIEVTPPTPSSLPEPAMIATPDQLREIGQPLNNSESDESADASENATAGEEK